MKLTLHFGLSGSKVEMNWWKEIKDFPYLVTYKDKKYELVIYEEDLTGASDYNCVFAGVQSYDPNWHATVYVSIESMMGYGGTKCECGAIYTSFPQIHMFFCPKWTKRI